MTAFLLSSLSSLFLGLSLNIWQLFLAILLGYKTYCGNNTINSATNPLSFTCKTLQLFAINAYLFVSFAGVCVVIPRTYYLLYNISIDHPMFARCHSLYFISMAFAYIFAYFLMFFKLYLTFKGSSYAIRGSIIRIHAGIAICTLLSGFATVYMRRNGFDILLVNGIFSVMLVLIMFALVYLVHEFNHRLFNLVQLLCSQTDININDIEEASSLSHTQITMLRVVKRQNVLGVFVVFLMFVGVATYMVAVCVTNGEYVTFSVYASSEIHMMIFDLIHVLMINIASFAVYLGFMANKTTNDAIDVNVNQKEIKECAAQIRSRVTADTTETE